MLRRVLDLILFGLICLFPFLCLIIYDQMLFPYVTSKNFAFRILLEISLALWGLLWIMDAKYRPKLSGISLSYIIFVASLTLADILGENVFRSFWSNYSRMEGLITHLHLLAYFLLLTTVLKTTKRWNLFIDLSLAVAFGVGVYSILQSLGYARAVSVIRVDGTFGNPSYLAIYMALHFFLGLYRLTQVQVGSLKNIYAFGAVVSLLSIYLTQTRSAVLGVVVGVFIICAGLLIPRRKNTFRSGFRRSLFRYLVFIFMGAGVVIAANKFFQMTPQLADRLTQAAGASVQNRLLIWQVSAEAFLDHPWFGYGQENFMYTLRYYDPGMWTEAWPDRAHNSILEWLISAGLFGCLSYLGIFVTTLYLLWFRYKTRTSPETRLLLTAFLGCYFINNLFLFDNIITYLIFFAVLAHLHFLVQSDAAQMVARSSALIRKRGWWVAISSVAIIAMLSATLYFVNYKNIAANLVLMPASIPSRALVENGTDLPDLRVQRILDPQLFARQEIREHLIATVSTLSAQPITDAFRNKLFVLANENFEWLSARDPQNIYLKMLGGEFYANFRDFNKAEALLREALSMSPRNQSILVQLGKMYLKKRDFKKAAAIYLDIYALEPSLNLAKVYRVVSLIYSENLTAARAQLQTMQDEKNEEAFNSEILAALLNHNLLAEAAQLLNEKAKINASDPEDLVMLGNYFVIHKQKFMALDSFDKARRLGFKNQLLLDSLIQQAQSLPD